MCYQLVFAVLRYYFVFLALLFVVISTKINNRENNKEQVITTKRLFLVKGVFGEYVV